MIPDQNRDEQISTYQMRFGHLLTTGQYEAVRRLVDSAIDELNYTVQTPIAKQSVMWVLQSNSSEHAERIANALEDSRYRCITLRDLFSLKYEQVRSISSMGGKSIEALETALEKAGIKWPVMFPAETPLFMAVGESAAQKMKKLGRIIVSDVPRSMPFEEQELFTMEELVEISKAQAKFARNS